MPSRLPLIFPALPTWPAYWYHRRRLVLLRCDPKSIIDYLPSLNPLELLRPTHSLSFRHPLTLSLYSSSVFTEDLLCWSPLLPQSSWCCWYPLELLLPTRLAVFGTHLRFHISALLSFIALSFCFKLAGASTTYSFFRHPLMLTVFHISLLLSSPFCIGSCYSFAFALSYAYLITWCRPPEVDVLALFRW